MRVIRLETGKGAEIPIDAMEKAKHILQNNESLTEYECKQVLAAYGVPVTREEPAASVEEAISAARRIGYPVALKVLSPDVPHKSEASAIKLGLCTDADVRRAFAEIMQNVKAYAPGAAVSGVLVQEMLEGGVEVIVGITRDPVFGPCVMFGLGGVFVEVLQDVSFRVAPLTANDAEEMIGEVKGSRVLAGVRGKPASDIKVLVDTILKISHMAVDCAEGIEELDINPLIVFPDGARVADALIVKGH